MGGACGTDVGQQRYIQEFLWGALREGEKLEDLGTDKRKILKRIFKELNGGLDWIDLS